VNLDYLLPPLIAAGISLSLLIMLLLHRRKERSHWLLSLLVMDVTIWALVIFGMRSSPDVEQALFWDRAVIFFVFAAPLLCYHFSVALTKVGRQGNLLPIGYIVLVVVLALSPTDLLVQRMEIQPYGYAPIIGPAMLPIVAFAYLLMMMTMYNFLKAYRASSEYREKNRLLYITIAMFFPLMGTIFEIFPTIYPTSIFGSIALCLFTTVAIVKYHLLDIRIVVRKSLVYLLVSLMIAVPYVGILYLLHFIFQPILESWWVHPIIILLLAIALRPLYSWAQNFVDRLFYRDRYNYLQALQQFSQKAQNVINLKELSSTLTQLVSGALHSSSVCLLLPSESDNGLIVVSSTGLNNPPSGVVLRSRSPLIKWLKLKQRILSSEEFNIVPQLQSLSLREKNNLEQMEAKLYVPIQTAPGQLSGILVLGQKLSQQLYSSEDRQLLTALSNQMAIALENARLYAVSQQELRERKQAEEALRKMEQEKTAILDSMSEIVIFQDMEYRLIWANKVAGESVDLSPEQLVGRHCYEIWNKRSEPCVGCPVAKAREAGKPQEAEMTTPDGRVWFVQGYPIQDANGRVVGVVEVTLEITERKRAEEKEKELQQELYESGRLAAIGELAAGVAHEINNPLTAILGFSQRVLRKSHNKSLARDLNRISGEALRAARIVQNLLTFARRREPEKEDCDANDILQRALELRAYELKTSNIKVVADLTPRLPKVRADSHQIQEVFLNVVLNAEQAMVEAHQGGTLAIKTCKNKGYVQIVFSDDGPGIAKENLHRIFLPFFSSRADKGGTGLGLSICHGIVTEHGGKIHAKSQLGEGTTFVVELPVATGKTSKRKTAEKKSARKADRYYQPISGS